MILAEAFYRAHRAASAAMCAQNMREVMVMGGARKTMSLCLCLCQRQRMGMVKSPTVRTLRVVDSERYASGESKEANASCCHERGGARKEGRADRARRGCSATRDPSLSALAADHHLPFAVMSASVSWCHVHGRVSCCVLVEI